MQAASELVALAVSAQDVAIVALIVGVAGSISLGSIIVVGRWIVRRADRHERANDTAHIVESYEVAAAQFEVDLLVGIAEIDDLRLAVNHEFDRLLGRGEFAPMNLNLTTLPKRVDGVIAS